MRSDQLCPVILNFIIGPDQTMVEQIVLDNPVYVNNQLRVIDISFVYSQEVCRLYNSYVIHVLIPGILTTI